MTEFCIFDLDGTLLDTLEDLAVSVNYALEKNGLPQHPIDSYRYFVGDGVLTLIRRASGSGDEGLVKALKADFDRHYNVHRYFIFRTAGCFTGSFILRKMNAKSFFAISSFMMLLAMIGLFVFHSKTSIYICIALIGYGNSNIFSIVFSQA